VVKPSTDGASLMSWARRAAGVLSRVVTQPPGNTSNRVAENCGARSSISMYRRAPGWSDGTWVAPAGSQVAVSRTTIAPMPARSLSRVSTERPSLTVTLLSVQPAGRDRRHGTSDADGTDWASSHCGSRSVQARLPMYSGVAPASLLVMFPATVFPTRNSSTTTSARSPIRRALQRWTRIGCGGVGSRRMNSACRSRPFSRSIRRSWDGSASTRAAANASLISSTENWRRARW
jgi:hypothetical protein